MSVANFAAAPYDVIIVKGDHYSEIFSFSGSDSLPLDLSDYSFSSKIRDESGSLAGTFTCTKITPTGSLYPTQVKRELSSAITSGLDGEYVHDFQWQVDGKIRTFLGGRFTVEPEVTY